MLPGGCTLCKPEGVEVTQDLANQSKKNISVQLNEMVNKVVPRNPLAEQQFKYRIESSIETAYLWNDEMTKAIAMSCIPMDIQNETNQTKQINDVLKWFKADFFTWCNKPKCQRCGVNNKMQGGGRA
jgi:hypothetical protein